MLSICLVLMNVQLLCTLLECRSFIVIMMSDYCLLLKLSVYVDEFGLVSVSEAELEKISLEE